MPSKTPPTVLTSQQCRSVQSTTTLCRTTLHTEPSCREDDIKVSGNFSITAPPNAVWQVMFDPATLCRLASTCEEAHQVSDTRYEGTIRTKITLFTFRAHIAGDILKQQEPHTLSVAVVGTSSGIPGAFRGQADLDLIEENGGTLGRYTIEGDVLGRLGAMGQPLLQLTAQHLANTFATKVSRYLSESDRGALDS
ncbi:MAG: CoxG family protein [Chloroflexota bacterium]